jgi:guanine deaminase
MNQLIERAIDLAIRNADRGQLPFGALVVRDGAVIAEGINTVLRDHDPIAHVRSRRSATPAASLVCCT